MGLGAEGPGSRKQSTGGQVGPGHLGSLERLGQRKEQRALFFVDCALREDHRLKFHDLHHRLRDLLGFTVYGSRFSLSGLLVSYLVCWQVGWLVGWLFGWLVGFFFFGEV